MAVHACLNCDRTEMQVPLIDWRYQGQTLTICVDCLPALIHKREMVMGKWRASQATQPEPEQGAQDAQR